MQSLANCAQKAAQMQAAVVAGVSAVGAPRSMHTTSDSVHIWIDKTLLITLSLLGLRSFRGCWHRGGRFAAPLHLAIVVREGLGPRLSPTVDQRNALLGRGASAPGPAAAGRGAASDADRWAACNRVKPNERATDRFAGSATDRTLLHIAAPKGGKNNNKCPRRYGAGKR